MGIKWVYGELIIGHICVHFQTFPTILGPSSDTSAELHNFDDDASFQSNLRAALELAKGGSQETCGGGDV